MRNKIIYKTLAVLILIKNITIIFGTTFKYIVKSKDLNICWSINSTFFKGDCAKNLMDNFNKEYNQLLKNLKTE